MIRKSGYRFSEKIMLKLKASTASTIHRRSAAIRQGFDLGRQQTRDRAALQSREWLGGHGRGLPIPT